MWHYSKNPSAVQVWLDSLPDDGRDVFLNLPMSCRGIFSRCQILMAIAKILLKK